jgi:phosphoribosylaminoimidazole-succinocarboxamide synthase
VSLPEPLVRGKVREVYPVTDDTVLLVASDRISAFDHVLPTPIPDKGLVLTALSLWWFERFADRLPCHVISADVAALPERFRAEAATLAGRSVLCRRLRMLPVECVVRGYLAGSGYADYRATGAVCGHRLPAGLQDGDRLPEPLFTPATKAPRGEHDQNITLEELAGRVGTEMATVLRARTLQVYREASRVAEAAGFLLADTKCEFGVDGSGRVVLADELLTPDSSRFWEAATWRPGGAQPSYDKQYLRDWLAGESGWDRTGPPPALPDEVVTATRHRYVTAYERLTGQRFEGYLAECWVAESAAGA